MKTSQIISTFIAACALSLGANAYAKCDNCGTVTNVKTIKVKGEGTGLGAVAGGVLGGVLGHQIGGGRGKDVATAGGAVAGALVGGNAGRNSGATYDKNVQRCQEVASTTPAYWDVTYNYRGTEHHVQMASPPGNTIAVNDRGEPRL